jgi:trehalose 6-phosphate phosphatase
MQAHLAAAELRKRRNGRHQLLLFDFDGTLAPFNHDPAAVYLAHDVAQLLGSLASQPGTTVGVISGRRLADLQNRISIPGDAYLAGFHGLEIHAPDETFMHPGAPSARRDSRSPPASGPPAPSSPSPVPKA